jgi:hypothetical protein
MAVLPSPLALPLARVWSSLSGVSFAVILSGGRFGPQIQMTPCVILRDCFT